MIINASGRTDIVAFYSKWFLNRMKEGYLDVRNPFYSKQVSRILLDTNHVDAFIFCTKNPWPIIPYLNVFQDYPILFQITLTPYSKDVEPNVIGKGKIIEAFHLLSQKLGKEHVVLRYDPIFISTKYTVEYHEIMFKRLLEQIKMDISKVIISFIDFKKNTVSHQKELGIIPFTDEVISNIASRLGKIAASFHLPIQTCAENYDLEKYGIQKGGCVDKQMIIQLTGKEKEWKQNRNRTFCQCVQTVDIGSYNTCPHFCLYCYANYDEKQVMTHVLEHDPHSSLLIGHLEEDEQITVRKS